MKFTNSLNFSQNLGKIQFKKAIIYKSVLKFKFFALYEKKFRKILKCDEN